jgi:KDO2-lipid IV(A) lauroyltransferase
MYNAAKTIVSVVRNGEIVALLADQSATEDKDIYIDFFGRKTATFKVVAELALRYKIPIIMGFAIRQSDGLYKAEVIEIDYSDLHIEEKISQENIRILTERHTKFLENIIRQHPDQ